MLIFMLTHNYTHNYTGIRRSTTSRTGARGTGATAEAAAGTRRTRASPGGRHIQEVGTSALDCTGAWSNLISATPTAVRTPAGVHK